jgi:hypothetical protein
MQVQIPSRTGLKQAITAGCRPKIDKLATRTVIEFGALNSLMLPRPCHVGKDVSVSGKLLEFRHDPLDHDGQEAGTTGQQQCYTRFFPHGVPPILVCVFKPVPR